MTTRNKAGQWRLVLDALGDISGMFSATLRSRPALQDFLRCAMELVDGDAGSIMLLGNDGTDLEVVAATGPRADIILGRRQALSDSIAGLAARSGEPVVLKGAASRLSAFPRDLACSIAVPMLISGRLIGMMNINCEASDKLDPSVINLLTLLARQASIFVETASLNEELDRKQKRMELLLDKLLYNDGGEVGVGAQMIEMPEPEPQGGRRPFAGKEPTDPREPYPLAERLTRRERQVLSLLVEGNSNKEIASSLSISLATVKCHVRETIGKLGAQDRTQAAVVALRRGLVG